METGKLAMSVLRTEQFIEKMEEEQKKLVGTINEICEIAARMKKGLGAK